MQQTLPSGLASAFQDRNALPAFPSNVQRLLELVNSDAEMSRIASEVEQDPAMAARVLKVANSAFYGLSRSVGTLDLAVVLLGLRNVRNIVLGIGFQQMLQEHELSTAYLGDDFQAHAQCTGKLARFLARTLRHEFHGEEFVSGLIHDVGKLVLLRAFPDEAANVAKQLDASTPVSKRLGLEVEAFGIDHAHVAAWAAEEWRLPERIAAAIAEHHDTDPESHLGKVVASANWVSHWLETPGAASATAFPDDSPPVRLLEMTDVDLTELRAACSEVVSPVE